MADVLAFPHLQKIILIILSSSKNCMELQNLTKSFKKHLTKQLTYNFEEVTINLKLFMLE